MLLSGGDDERSLGRARGRRENRSSDVSLPLRAWMTGGERGLILSLPGTGLRGACCWTPLGAGSGPFVPAVVHAGVVILRPCRSSHPPSTSRRRRNFCYARRGSRGRHTLTPLHPAQLLFCCCNPSVARAAPPVPVLIHAGVVVRLQRPTGGIAPAGRIDIAPAGRIDIITELKQTACCCVIRDPTDAPHPL